MRCDDLTRELACPTGLLSSHEIAAHLAACPSCAAWSRQATRFEQIWEATRPLEPSPLAMDALWASASVALDAPQTATLSLEGLTTQRRSWLKPALLMAQAAALLIAAGLFLLRARENVKVEPLQVAVVTPVKLDVDVKEGETAIVRIGEDLQDDHEVVIQTEEVASASSSIPDDSQHGLFNAIEGMASNAFGNVASR
jgi:predicted anti-sigma-YlaC factor YlaD